MKIRYIGPSSEGVTLAPEAGGIHFPHGQPVDVPDELAKNLLEQGTFKKAAAAKPPGRGSATRTNPDVESR